MKTKNLLAAIVALTLVGTASAHAAVLKSFATLTGDQEVPSVTTTATGQASLTIDKVARTLSVSLSVMGIKLSDLFDVHGLGPVHLHEAPAGSNGGVVVPFTRVAGGYMDTAEGFELNRSMVPFADISSGPDFESFVSALNASEIYFNVHTETFNSGEIRGQPGELQPVPLPASALLLFGAIGGLAGLRRLRAR